MEHSSFMVKRDDRATSEFLEEVARSNDNGSDEINMFELKIALHERGFGVLMLLFALPLSVPVPVPPGYTTVLSVPLLLFPLQLLFGFDSPWIPKWLGKRSIKRSTLALVIEKTAPILKKIEKFMKPRLTFFFNQVGDKIIALIALLCGISIAIPLPLTNFIPAAGIAFMSLGLLSKDGIVVAIGILISFLGLALTAATSFAVLSNGNLLKLIFGNSWVFYGLLILEILVVIFLSSAINRLSASVAQATFVVYSILNGLTLSVIFLVYTGSSIATVFIITAGMFALISAYGQVTKRDLTSVGSFAFMGTRF